VTLLWALFTRHSPGVNLLAALVVLLFAISMFHHNKQARYLFPMLPAFFLLAGYGVAEFWRWAQGRSGVWRALGVIGLLLLVFQSGMLLRAAIQPGPGPRSELATAYIVENIREVSNTLVIASMEMNSPSPPLLDWQLSTEAGLLMPPQAGAAAQIEEGRRMEEIATRLPLPTWLARPLSQVLTGYDQPASVRTLYVGLPQRASYSQGVQGYSAFVHDLLTTQAIDQVLIVYRTQGTPRYGQEFLAAPMARLGWSLRKAQDVAGVGMKVEVWRP
jgi:hypothetical protein